MISPVNSASPVNVDSPSTAKSCCTVRPLRSATVTFRDPVITSIVEVLGGAVPNVNVVPLTLYVDFSWYTPSK